MALLFSATAQAAPQQDLVETTWRLLDYIAVDYPGAVQNGRVVSTSEFAEMREFSATVRKNVALLGPGPSKAALVEQAGGLERAIAAKGAPRDVALAARNLATRLLAGYPVPLAPTTTPNLARGAQLYHENCAACHGAAGMGDGPAAAGLDPPPIDFTDRARARQRSLFALDQVISQGLSGTAMPGFRQLPEADRWALAFHVGQFAFPDALARQGERLWQADTSVRKAVPDLKTLVSLSPEALAARIGEDKAASVSAYLRSSPEALERSDAGSLALTRERLAQSVAAYRTGDGGEAKRLALSAYLDGFEPVEPVLSSRDPALMRRIETAMGGFRAAIGRGVPVADIQGQAADLDDLFAQAEEVLGTSSSGGISTFVSALTILLREGVEALLIVVAMVAFLRKSDRTDALRYVHGGWIAALAAGLLTWIAATQFLSISGASRELTEGFGGILAAVVLVSVGIWMHGKSQADTWQRYIREKMSHALTKGSAWFLFGLAFVVVYREVFETILFYAAMWTDDGKFLVASGAGVGAVLLGGLAWVMLRYSVRLPIAEFFRYSSILMAILAVVLAGKGAAALQEAGLLDVSPVGGVPQIDALGIHPTVQVLLAQAIILISLVIGFTMNNRRGARLASHRAG